MSQNEAQFLRKWQKHAAMEQQPFAMAHKAGSAADDLAWVFMAGYQAAIRATFPNTDLPGWAALAVSEDQSEASPLPGVTWQAHPQGLVLQGFKTWIAGVDHIEHLIVRARGASTRYACVGRAAAGLTLTCYPTRGFLPALSQGKAELDNVVVTAEQQLNDALVPSFADCESLYIYVAFMAMLQNSVVGQTLPRTLAAKADAALQLAADIDPTQRLTVHMADLDDQVQQICQQLSGDVYADDANWMRDAKLLTMYSRGVQRRVAEAGET